MANKKTAPDERLGVRYLDNHVLLTATDAWTYVRLPLLSYEFQSYFARESFAEQIGMALAGLVTDNSKAIDIHLRVTHRPFDTVAWAGQINNRVVQQHPAPGWTSYLTELSEFVDQQGFENKEVYLGVKLGFRKPATTKADLLDPLKLVTNIFERVSGVEDDIVKQAELDQWHAAAADVRRNLANSHLRAVPASAEQVAWLIAQPMWPAMEQPDPSATPAEIWGPGELYSLVDGIVTHQRRWIEVEQVDRFGQSQTGYSATLAVSRFPDAMSFPEQEPWIHMAASFGFPVDFSVRASLMPAMEVKKDVGKKLADAMDQAQHIAEAGTSVPLNIREQLQVATTLEYTIDKDRMPWAYARHRLTVTGSSVEELTARAKTLIENYRELGIDVVWPSGDQLDLLREAMPGEKVRAGAYYQRQEVNVIAGGMPTASSEAGDRPDGTSGWFGPYLGHTTSRVVTPVFFSPHVAMAKNAPPGVAITGAPGGGKSFLAFTLAHQMAMQGVWTIYIDPKADAKPMANLKGLGNPRVFDLRDGNDGMLDPFSLGKDLSESKLLALETLRLLLGSTQISEEREEAIHAAINKVTEMPNPSLNAVVEVLLNHPTSTGARNLGGILSNMRDLPFARLCFSATRGQALRPEDGLTVVTLLGLDLPSTATAPEHYSYENRLAVSVMYLLTRYSRQLMLNMDKSQPKAICIDEAWAITSTPQGARLIPEIARMGRSHNTALILVSQNAGDLMEEAVTNSISTKFAFRSTIQGEISDVLDLFGLDQNQGYGSAVRDLRNGECLMQDVDGRVARVQIDAWNRDLFETFNTNPETRGKGAKQG